MSGTSADGIDAAVVDFHRRGPRTRLSLLHFVTIPYSPPMRAALLDVCYPNLSRIPDICALNAALGELFAQAAIAAAAGAGISLNDVAAIASHGQTIWHQPNPRAIGDITARGTLQISDSAVIAARTG